MSRLTYACFQSGAKSETQLVFYLTLESAQRRPRVPLPTRRDVVMTDNLDDRRADSPHVVADAFASFELLGRVRLPEVERAAVRVLARVDVLWLDDDARRHRPVDAPRSLERPAVVELDTDRAPVQPLNALPLRHPASPSYLVERYKLNDAPVASDHDVRGRFCLRIA